MCTSVKVISKEKHCFCGRTSEFDVPLNYVLVAIPRDYIIKTTQTPCNVKFGVIGVGAEGLELVQDGVNEVGLAGITQYFANEFRYADVEKILGKNKKPVRGEEMLTWILTHYSSIEDVKINLNNDIAASNTSGVLGFAVPQHIALYDKTGASIVVEPTLDCEFKIYDNPIGTMTNQPSFDWHLKNLYNYTGMTQKINPAVDVRGQKLLTSGKGTGLFGMPGDYTPQSRFVRATVLSSLAEVPDDDFAPQMVFHILNSFDIPRGVIEIVANNTPQHTQYTTAYDCEHGILYYHDYYNRCIQRLSITEEDMSKDVITVYRIQKNEEIIDVRENLVQ